MGRSGRLLDTELSALTKSTETNFRSATADLQRLTGQSSVAAGLMGRDAGRWHADYRQAAAGLGLAADEIESDLHKVARGSDRAADRISGGARRIDAGVRRAGDQTGISTGAMRRAWQGLDILDDIGGVVGMLDGLTRGLRDAAAESIRASRTIETELSRLKSIDLDVTEGELAGLRDWADTFVTQRGGVTDYGSRISELVAITSPEMIALQTASQSSGLDPLGAQASAELSAGLSRLPGAGTPEESRSALIRMSLFADPAQDLAPQMEGWADMLAEAQRIGNIPAMSTLTGAIEASVKTATTLGMTVHEFLAVLTTFHRADEGDPVGEALNSINEELQGGMKEMGLQPSFRADGGIDFVGSLRTLREHRLERADLGKAEWIDYLGGTFGELGGREIGALTGPLWKEFVAGIPSLQAADERDMLVTRLTPLQDRDLMEGQIGAREDVARTMMGDHLEPLDTANLRRRSSLVDSRIASLKATKHIPDVAISGDKAALFSAVVPMAVNLINRAFRGLLGDAGRSIGETLAAGVPEGGPALGAAMEGVLLTQVDPLMAHSDAIRGPLSTLTASGRAIPETLAGGVLQSRGVLGAALSGALALPQAPLTEVQASFGSVDSPLLPESPLTELLATYGSVDSPLLPESPLTELLASFGSVDSPLLPESPLTELLATYGSVDSPLLPESPLTELLASFGSVDSPLLPESPLTELLATYGSVDSPLLPESPLTELLATYGSVDSPLLPESPLTELLATYGSVDSPLLPESPLTELLASFGSVDSPLLPESPLTELLASFGSVDSPLLPESPLTELLATYGSVDSPLLPESPLTELLASFGSVDSPLLPESPLTELLASFGSVDSPLLPESPLTELLATYGAVDSPLLPESPLTELLATYGAVDSPLLPESPLTELLATYGAVDSPLLPESPLTELLASYGAVDSPLLPESPLTELLASYGAVDSPLLPESPLTELLATYGSVDSPLLPESPLTELLASFGSVDSPLLPESPLTELLATYGAVDSRCCRSSHHWRSRPRLNRGSCRRARAPRGRCPRRRP